MLKRVKGKSAVELSSALVKLLSSAGEKLRGVVLLSRNIEREKSEKFKWKAISSIIEQHLKHFTRVALVQRTNFSIGQYQPQPISIENTQTGAPPFDA